VITFLIGYFVASFSFSSVAYRAYWLPCFTCQFQIGRLSRSLATLFHFPVSDRSPIEIIGYLFHFPVSVRSPIQLIGYPVAFFSFSSVAYPAHWLPCCLLQLQFGRLSSSLATLLPSSASVRSPIKLIGYPVAFFSFSSVAYPAHWLPCFTCQFQIGRLSRSLATLFHFPVSVRSPIELIGYPVAFFDFTTVDNQI